MQEVYIFKKLLKDRESPNLESVHTSMKYYTRPTVVFNSEIEDITCGVAPIQQHVTDLHVINISCWYNKYSFWVTFG